MRIKGTVAVRADCRVAGADCERMVMPMTERFD
jgi:hypothetical protein